MNQPQRGIGRYPSRRVWLASLGQLQDDGVASHTLQIPYEKRG